MEFSVRQRLAGSFPGAAPAEGILGGLARQHPFYRQHPWALPVRNRSLRALCEPRPVPQYQYLGNHPKDRENGWSENLQGVTHDDRFWYFSQVGKLWRFPRGHNLNIGVGEIRSEWAARGILRVEMPGDLKAQGYNHYGDLDWFEGHLYVPLEGTTPRKIVLVDAATLTVLSTADVPQGHAPWCAVHPHNGLLYSSTFNNVGLVTAYHRRVTQGKLELSLVGNFELFDQDGRPMIIDNVQGGTFSSNGHLYLVSAATDVRRAGIYVFDMITGRKRARIHVDHNPTYGSTNWTDDELEGITLWDLDDGSAPQIGGQIHMVMIDLVGTGDNDLYFKHFRASSKEHL